MSLNKIFFLFCLSAISLTATAQESDSLEVDPSLDSYAEISGGTQAYIGKLEAPSVLGTIELGRFKRNIAAEFRYAYAAKEALGGVVFKFFKPWKISKNILFTLGAGLGWNAKHLEDFKKSIIAQGFTKVLFDWRLGWGVTIEAGVISTRTPSYYARAGLAFHVED